MKRTRRAWTKRDDAGLRRAWRKGLTIANIAKELGRTRKSVVSRVERLGLPRRWVGWTRAEDMELRRLWRARESPPFIAEQLERTLAAVFSRAQVLGLPGRRKGR